MKYAMSWLPYQIVTTKNSTTAVKIYIDLKG